MEPFYLLAAIAIVSFISLLGAISSVLGGAAHRARYERRLPFLSPAERRALAALEEAVGDEYRVLARVALAALVTVAPNTRGAAARAGRDSLHGQTVDFVLCARIDDHPSCAIQHLPAGKLKRAERRRLARLRDLCAAAKLPLVTLTEQPHHDPAALRERFAAVLDTRRHAMHNTDHPSADEEAILLRLSAALRDSK